MSEAATSAVELTVGIGCIVGAIPAIRKAHLRLLGGTFAVAGAVAIAHAVWALMT